MFSREQESLIEAWLDRMTGTPSAAKRGRNPNWPYVPIIDHGEQSIGVYRTRTRQLRGKAFETRAEAVAYAESAIQESRRKLAARLIDPRERALRESVGLPREI